MHSTPYSNRSSNTLIYLACLLGFITIVFALIYDANNNEENSNKQIYTLKPTPKLTVDNPKEECKFFEFTDKDSKLNRIKHCRTYTEYARKEQCGKDCTMFVVYNHIKNPLENEYSLMKEKK